MRQPAKHTTSTARHARRAGRSQSDACVLFCSFTSYHSTTPTSSLILFSRSVISSLSVRFRACVLFFHTMAVFTQSQESGRLPCRPFLTRLNSFSPGFMSASFFSFLFFSFPLFFLSFFPSLDPSLLILRFFLFHDRRCRVWHSRCASGRSKRTRQVPRSKKPLKSSRCGMWEEEGGL